MPRVLLLMSTRSYRAEAFLAAAARIGVEVTVGTEREHVLGHLTPAASLSLDFRDGRRAREQIVELARIHPLDAVVGVDDDTSVLAALAAEALGLPHNSVESAKAARSKDVMRLVLSESDLLSPRFELLVTDDDPRTATQRLTYPVVVKPLTLSASRGVIRANDPDQLVAAFRQVVEILSDAALAPDDPGSSRVLVEEFIPGREVALEGLLESGALTVLATFDKPDPLDGPYFEETIYVTPSRLPAEVQASIVECTARACTVLGLREGPIHAELRLNELGVWVVEVAARSIGGQCSRALRFEYDLSLEEIIIRQAARLPMPNLRREKQASGVMMLPIAREGVLRAVRGIEQAQAVPGVEGVSITVPRGEVVVPLPRATRYLGFIFARAATPEAVEAALREAHRQLDFDIG